MSTSRPSAIESSEQCLRLDIPEIEEERKLTTYLKSWPSNRCLIFCDEQNLKGVNFIKQLNTIKNEFSKWGIIIGPEGGFSKQEREAILNLANVYSVSLGKRILKSDTAATVSLYCIQQIIDI